jgi:hypothetical protein
VVDSPEPLLDKAPVDGAGELHGGMAGIDDLVEPGSEKIRLARVASLFGSLASPRRDPDSGMESWDGARINLPEKKPYHPPSGKDKFLLNAKTRFRSED